MKMLLKLLQLEAQFDQLQQPLEAILDPEDMPHDLNGRPASGA